MNLRRFYLKFLSDRSLLCRLLLLTGWILGIILGYILSRKNPADFSLMRMLIQSHMSIVGGLVVAFLPLVASAVIVWFFHKSYLIALAFVKGFCFSFTACAVVMAFGDIGYLARWFYLFSDSILAFVYLNLWLECFSVDFVADREFLKATLFCSICFSIDIFMISPCLSVLL